MASSLVPLLFQLPLLALMLSGTFLPLSMGACFNSIFSFGDSLADTGNLILSDIGNDSRVRNPPYGETYFGHPTGRYCDGRVIVDFIAQAIGKPLLPPYLAKPKNHKFRRGVNFAVAGATALSSDFFRERGIEVTWTEYSLGVQIKWFKELLSSICSNERDCTRLFEGSLFLLGEIGGNDYNHPFTAGRNYTEIRTFVPLVINSISSAINDVIKVGARILVVPGNFPIGCNPVYLTIFQNSSADQYDPKTGCINWLNEFSEYHNQLLQDELDRLRRLHPNTTIIYANYYEAALTMYRSPKKFGFDNAPLAACCGGGGPYNYNSTAVCGKEGKNVCDDPSRSIVWDGNHLTEAAYKIIANGLLKGPFASPPISSLCPSKRLRH